MYKNLKAEMARRDVSIQKLANLTGIRYQTLTAKLRGDTYLTLPEAIKIADQFDDCTLDYLFR
jgi:plasmid maintenance system antidote protein VapI